MGIVGRYLPRGEILGGLIGSGAALLLIEWVHRDRLILAFNLGVALSFSILFVTPIGLFVYFVKSRGWRRGLKSYGLAVVVFLGLVLSYALGELIGRDVSMLLLDGAI